MKRKTILKNLTILGVSLSLLLGSGVALAQQGDGYDLTWNTFDGSGGTSGSGGYSLSGSIGQPDADVLTGGNYRLAGGFWAGGAANMPSPSGESSTLYLPVVMK